MLRRVQGRIELHPGREPLNCVIAGWASRGDILKFCQIVQAAELDQPYRPFAVLATMMSARPRIRSSGAGFAIPPFVIILIAVEK